MSAVHHQAACATRWAARCWRGCQAWARSVQQTKGGESGPAHLSSQPTPAEHPNAASTEPKTIAQDTHLKGSSRLMVISLMPAGAACNLGSSIRAYTLSQASSSCSRGQSSSRCQGSPSSRMVTIQRGRRTHERTKLNQPAAPTSSRKVTRPEKGTAQQSNIGHQQQQGAEQQQQQWAEPSPSSRKVMRPEKGTANQPQVPQREKGRKVR